jgi:hypothetical protein
MARDEDLDAARFLSVAYGNDFEIHADIVHSLFIRVVLIQHMFFSTEQLTSTSQNMFKFLRSEGLDMN